MDVTTLLDRLDTYLSECSRLPLVAKIVVDEDEVFGLIDDLRAAIPQELEQAKWLLKERDRILQEARKEAGEIMKDAQGQIATLASESVIAKEARMQAEELIEKAQEVAGDIHMGARHYADEIMKNVESLLDELLTKVKDDRRELALPQTGNPGQDLASAQEPEAKAEGTVSDFKDDQEGGWDNQHDYPGEEPRKRWFRGRD